MTDAWKTLLDAGVPLGAPRPAPRKAADPASLRAALGAVRAATLEESERVAVLAFLRGFRSHWPTRFASDLGADGENAIAALERDPFDANRYLKLRRIAIANLANVI